MKTRCMTTTIFTNYFPDPEEVLIDLPSPPVLKEDYFLQENSLFRSTSSRNNLSPPIEEQLRLKQKNG